MRAQRLTGFALIVFGVALALNAMVGPLVLGVMRLRFLANFTNQYLGGEIVSLFLVAPVAVIAGVLWLRGHRLAPVLAFAPAIYGLYLMVTLVFGADYAHQSGNQEQFFPLHWLIIVLSWGIAVRAWMALRPDQMPLPSDRLRRTTAMVLLFIAAFFALAWLRQVAAVIGGEAVPDYPEAATLFWMIRVFDLAFFIPLAVISAVGLLRRQQSALRLAYLLIGFFTCEICAVAGMMAVQIVTADPAANAIVFAVLLAGSAGTVWLSAALVRSFARAPEEVIPAPTRGPAAPVPNTRPAG